MKIIYYVTDHGLGHATRTVAIIKEFKKRNVDIVLRSDDQLEFFKKSLSDIKIIHGPTDFMPIMQKNNSMRFSTIKTKKNLISWIHNLPTIIAHESQILKKIQPDLVISDTSFMPILVAKFLKIPSVLIANFVWHEVLTLPQYLKSYLFDSYSQSNLIIKLPFGSKMNFKNKHNLGLIARYPTLSKTATRKILGIKKSEKLILISLPKFSKSSFQIPSNVKILNISDYSNIKNHKFDFLINGQNLVNAADVVICKCGFGFISECLTSGTPFYYIVDKKHKESNAIHKELLKNGIHNRINSESLSKNLSYYVSINLPAKKMPFSNNKIVDFITSFYEKVI